MFRSLVILLLINSYGRGLGNPVSQSTPILSYALAELAKSCLHNKFLASELSSHLQGCNVPFVKPHTEIQLQCILFYDMSAQLCAAAAANTLELKEDKTGKLKEDMSILDLCNDSKHWNLTDLPNFPSYKPSVSKVLSNDLFCGRLCGGPDLYDVNYYCKFYKWGTDVLKPPKQPLTLSGIQNKGEQSLTGVEDTKSQPIAASSTTKINETQLTEVQKPIRNELSTTNKKPSSDDGSTANVAEKSAMSAVGHQGLPTNTVGVQSVLTSSGKDFEEAANDDVPADKDAQPNVSKTEISTNEETVQEEVPSIIPDNKVDSGLPQKDLEGQKNGDDKAAVIETPKLNSAPIPEQDDYQDSDEGKEGLLDLQNNDDSIDPAIGDLNEPPYQQPTKPPTKKIAAPISSSFNGESQRDMYNAQDMYNNLDEDDDDFFPFFLVSMLLLVLLYVLYHNKSKVSKVVLGLIFEGRQSGRRRNSRGHSYRRLDTLEQAMSSNTGAPPSKIIY